MSREQFWKMILDTTPRQWGFKISSFFGGLNSSKINWTFSSAKFVGLSIFAHIAFLGALFIPPSSEHIKNPKDHAFEIELVQSGSSKYEEVSTVFDDSSEIYVYAPKKKKKKMKAAIDSLLDKYGNLSVANSSDKLKEKVKKVKRAWRGERLATLSQDSTQEADVQRSLESTKIEVKNRDGKVSKEKMSQHLALYQKQFQFCYEKALFKDTSLNGKIQFQLKTDEKGNIASSLIEFEGVGLPRTRATLRGCLSKIVDGIQFPKAYASAFSRTIQFQAVLSL